MSQEQFLGSWGETGNNTTPLILCKAPMPGPGPVQPIQPIWHWGCPCCHCSDEVPSDRQDTTVIWDLLSGTGTLNLPF